MEALEPSPPMQVWKPLLLSRAGWFFSSLEGRALSVREAFTAEWLDHTGGVYLGLGTELYLSARTRTRCL